MEGNYANLCKLLSRVITEELNEVLERERFKKKPEVRKVSLNVTSVAETQSRTPAHSRPPAVINQPGVRDCTLYSCMRQKYEYKNRMRVFSFLEHLCCRSESTHCSAAM